MGIQGQTRMSFTASNEAQHTRNQIKTENKPPFNFDTKAVSPPEVQQMVSHFLDRLSLLVSYYIVHSSAQYKRKEKMASFGWHSSPT